MKKVSPTVWESVVKNAGSRADAAKNLIAVVRSGLDKYEATNGKEGWAPEQVSLRDVAYSLDLLDKYDLEGSFERLCDNCRTIDPSKIREEAIFTESNPGLTTNAFQVLTGELLGRMVMEGFNNTSNFIGDELVTVVGVRQKNTKIPGVTLPGGPLEVPEGHPYSETDIAEKWVSTEESKKGRIISVSEELLLQDQLGLIRLAANDIGFTIRQERERTIVRGVQDADSGSGRYVYRPSGVGTVLYNTDGSLKNYIGSGNTTDTAFNAASALADWTDIDHVRLYRATAVKDDRIDGTPLPIAGLNGPQNILLVPEAKFSTGWYIANQTSGVKITNTAVDETNFSGNPVQNVFGKVLSSPFVDEVSAHDYYLGDFRRQFVWSEIWPVQTFVQGRGSEAAFERDTALRVKVRYFGGLSARETRLVTKIDGN